MSPRYISVGHINIPLSQTAMPSKLQMNSYSAHPMNSGSKALCTGPRDISLENSQILTPLTKVSQKRVLCWTSNLFLQKNTQTNQTNPWHIIWSWWNNSSKVQQPRGHSQYNRQDDVQYAFAKGRAQQGDRGKYLRTLSVKGKEKHLPEFTRYNMKAVLRWKFINVPDNHRDLN